MSNIGIVNLVLLILHFEVETMNPFLNGEIEA